VDGATGADPALAEGREAYRRRDWRAAYDRLRPLCDTGALEPEDLCALADSAWWMGRVGEHLEISEEAHRRYLADGRADDAAVNALDLGFVWMMRGDAAIGSGWISRARRLLAGRPAGVAHGFLRYVDVSTALDDLDLDAAVTGARELQELGDRYGAPTLTSLGLLTEGLARIRAGDVRGGFGLVDEAMLPVLADQVKPDWAGSVYCSTMLTCHQLADVKRAREWNRATRQWCASFSDAVMFLGVCRLHSVQLMFTEGAWADAATEARRVCQELDGVNMYVVAEGRYWLGELCRVRGDLAGARSEYDAAADLGRDPQPGRSLLLLADGDPDGAWRSVTAAVATAGADPFLRVRLLCAQVEIALAAGRVEVAGHAADELVTLAGTYRTPGFEAWARQAAGAVALARGRPGEAVEQLTRASRLDQDQGSWYDLARVRLLLARALRQAGEPDAAEATESAARATLRDLGAAAPVVPTPTAERPGGLTAREVEVLALVARGASNRDVARTLTISEKTVGRHLANVFTKLGVGSRTAAAAWAHEHRVSGSPSLEDRSPA
jgi:DNA-binding CsgD family transcriptional regulator